MGLEKALELQGLQQATAHNATEEMLTKWMLTEWLMEGMMRRIQKRHICFRRERRGCECRKEAFFTSFLLEGSLQGPPLPVRKTFCQGTEPSC